MKPRRRPFDTTYVIDRTINETETLKVILEASDPTTGYSPIATNWYIEYVRAILPRHDRYIRNLLGELPCGRPSGPEKLLETFAFGGKNAVSEVRKFRRTAAGDAYMAERGRGRLPLNIHRASDRHEYFGSMVMMSIDFGMRRDGLELAGPREIFMHKMMGEFDPKEPYTFRLPGNRRYTHDNHPRVARYKGASKLLIPEWDLDNEGILKQYDKETGKVKASIEDKFEKIIEVIRRKRDVKPLYQERYGIKDAFLLFATVSQRHAENVASHIAAKHGRQENILIMAFPEFKDLNATIPVTLKAWDEPWLRPGLPPFSLKTLT